MWHSAGAAVRCRWPSWPTSPAHPVLGSRSMVPSWQDLGAWANMTAASTPLMEGVDLTATEGPVDVSAAVDRGAAADRHLAVLTREVK
ncbi:hypothetical protein QJS66_16075 [Kocuria rhizophila]|nr:hypothetical protein QJS66_16075 [Kocuria rhizophila]